MYEDSSSDDDGPGGSSLYLLLAKRSRPHYKSILRAFRRAHNRKSYIGLLRRRGAAVLDPPLPALKVDAASLSPRGLPEVGSIREEANAFCGSTSISSAVDGEKGGGGPMDSDGEADEDRDMGGLHGVVRLPFALASEGAMKALESLARAMEAGSCTSRPVCC